MTKAKLPPMRLTREERDIENAVLRGEYRPVPKAEFERTLAMLRRFRKDAILHIRINSLDLQNLKRKAAKAKVPYQTFIAELLHQYAAG